MRHVSVEITNIKYECQEARVCAVLSGAGEMHGSNKGRYSV